MIIITGLSLAAYRDFNETRKLEEGAKSVVAGLELAKKKAIAGDKPCVPFDGAWLVVWSQVVPDRYFMQVNGCLPPMPAIVFFLPSNLQFTNSGAVYFYSFGHGTNANPMKTIIIKNTTTNKIKNITIDQGGNIAIQ